MKLVIAYIQPEKLADVKQALFDVDITKISLITNALGCGSQKGFVEEYRGVSVEVNLRMKVRLEIAVNEDYLEKCVGAIIKGAHTGSPHDGKIFVVELAECIRISSGERGRLAVG